MPETLGCQGSFEKGVEHLFRDAKHQKRVADTFFFLAMYSCALET